MGGAHQGCFLELGRAQGLHNMYGVIHKIFKISLGLSFGDRAHKGLGFRVKG